MEEKASPTEQYSSAARVLRCRNTKRYFNGDGWSADAHEAQVFPDEIEAMRACVTHNLQDMELVLRAQVTGVELFSTPVR